MAWRTKAVDVVREIMDGDVGVKEFQGVPHVNQVPTGNGALAFPACVLSIDLRESTAILDEHRRPTAVKIFKAFHEVTCRVVDRHGGRVRSFDGDGILALWYAPDRERIHQAVAAAISMKDLLQGKAGRAMARYRAIDFGIGLDCGQVHAAKVGPDSSSSDVDLVWLGHPVNFAVTLANSARAPKSVWVSDAIYHKLEPEWKFEKPGAFMFKGGKWEEEGVQYQGDYHRIHQLADKYRFRDS